MRCNLCSQLYGIKILCVSRGLWYDDSGPQFMLKIEPINILWWHNDHLSDDDGLLQMFQATILHVPPALTLKDYSFCT
jgi:hypothetical protein